MILNSVLNLHTMPLLNESKRELQTALNWMNISLPGWQSNLMPCRWETID